MIQLAFVILFGVVVASITGLLLATQHPIWTILFWIAVFCVAWRYPGGYRS